VEKEGSGEWGIISVAPSLSWTSCQPSNWNTARWGPDTINHHQLEREKEIQRESKKGREDTERGRGVQSQRVLPSNMVALRAWLHPDFIGQRRKMSAKRESRCEFVSGI